MENRGRQAQFVRALVAGEIVDDLGAQNHLEALRFGHRPVLRIFSITGSRAYDGGRWNARAATVLDAIEADAGDLGKLIRLPVMFAPTRRRVDRRSTGTSSGAERVGVEPRRGDRVRVQRVVPGGPHRSRTAAKRATSAPRRAAETRGVRAVNFEDVGIADWLLNGHDRDTTAAKATAQLAPPGGKETTSTFYVCSSRTIWTWSPRQRRCRCTATESNIESSGWRRCSASRSAHRR